MTNVAIVYHSGFGHTRALAESVATGARSAGAEVDLIPVAEAEARAAQLDAADAIVFGSPTYMGGVSADFASWNGDKHNTLYQLLTLAVQHGMVWVGLGLPPGNNSSKGSVEDLNRVGASVGAMAQAHADQGVEGIAASDFRTFEALGRRIAEAAQRWRGEPLARAA
jgi:NAD(P)H dehydrogenase (quinone)